MLIFKKLYASKEVKENALASEGKSCRPETKTTVNQYVCHELASGSDAQRVPWNGGPNVCLQAFSLFPLPSSSLDQRPVHRLDKGIKSKIDI